jgi:hypothetical protein
VREWQEGIVSLAHESIGYIAILLVDFLVLISHLLGLRLPFCMVVWFVRASGGETWKC